jgi:hypothetical protein
LGNGISYSSLTKVLHPKRPKFLPICDSRIVKHVLSAPKNKKPNTKAEKAYTIVTVMNEFRKIGKKNLRTLNEIRVFLDENEALPGFTNIRMLEALFWMDEDDQLKKLSEFAEKIK